ncbi:UNVERIFIED_CONTAM: hypothetical protein Sangu_1972600 [Sesamum angustifolium]|uniref:Uncharacterized protein n=1 Tax=Sesamum angustifolium TaxID=2727405 RepID=A0AAW2LXR4_9LAMI
MALEHIVWCSSSSSSLIFLSSPSSSSGFWPSSARARPICTPTSTSTYTGGQRWSLRQVAVVALHLLDEPSDEEEVRGNEEEEGSSPREGTPPGEMDTESSKAKETNQSRAEWVPSCIHLFGILHLMEEFGIA